MIDSSGPTPEAILVVHQSELRLARRQCLSRALFLLACAAFWLVAGSARLLPFAMIVGGALFLTVVAALEWWRLAHTDPFAAYTAEAAARAQAAEDWHAHHAARMAARSSTWTWLLIAAISAVGLLQLFVGGASRSVGAAGLVKPAARAGEWWRLLTGTYLHGSLVHFLGNLSALSAFGRLMEAYGPPARVPLVYLLSALAGSLASLIVTPHTSSVGASGGIVGLAGYLLILARRRPDQVPPGLQTSVLATFGLAACIGLVGFAFIDNGAHVGGALAGMLVGVMTIPHKDETPAHVRMFEMLGWGAAAIVIAGALFTAQRIVRVERGWQAARAPSVTPDTITPIEGAIARVVSSSSAPVTVAIENRRDVAIEAWKLDVYSGNGRLRPIESRVVDGCCFHYVGESAPIAPHEVRTLSFDRTPARVAPAATLTVVIFSDLAFEGSKNERDALLRRREEVAADLAYWIDVIHQTLGMPIGKVQAFLSERLNVRAREAQAARKPFREAGMMALIKEAEQRPDRFAATAKQRLADLEQERRALLRHQQR